jgi:endonuclease/exonuclease/phosphatase family metal-dependent hydrolase
MYKPLLVTFILIIISNNVFFGQKSITVALYNCENFFDTKDDPTKNDDEFLPTSKLKWDDERYMNKLTKVAQVLDSTVSGEGLPSIIGLVEIENIDVLKDLIAKSQFSKKSFEAICTDSPDERSIDVGLLFDKNTFQLETYKELNATNPELGDYKTRNVLYAALKTKKGELVHVFVNHWPSRREGVEASEPRRLFASQQVRNKINEIQAKDINAKIIVMGDLNDHPNNKSVLEVLSAKDKPVEKNDLYNPYFSLDNNKQGTHYYDKEWRVLDQIILSQGLISPKKGFGYKTNSASILKKDFVLYKNPKTGEERPNRTYSGEKYFNGYSDHLAVYLELEIK